MNSFKQGISSPPPPPPPPPQKSVQFWAFQLNLRFCLKNSRRTDPHSRMSDMCKKTTLVGTIIFTSLDPPMNLQPGSEQRSARLHSQRSIALR